MKTKVRALTSFMHGRIHMQTGEEGEFTKGDADELEKAGLVKQAKETAPEDEQPEAETQGSRRAPEMPQADDNVDDLLGEADQKMEGEPQNKMDAEPDNKASGKKTTHKAK